MEKSDECIPQISFVNLTVQAMLYESDINSLLSQWQERLNFQTAEQPYKDAIRDCIYDVRMLMDENFKEEMLAREAFEQQLKEDDAKGLLNINPLIPDGNYAA